MSTFDSIIWHVLTKLIWLLREINVYFKFKSSRWERYLSVKNLYGEINVTALLCIASKIFLKILILGGCTQTVAWFKIHPYSNWLKLNRVAGIFCFVFEKLLENYIWYLLICLITSIIKVMSNWIRIQVVSEIHSNYLIRFCI